MILRVVVFSVLTAFWIMVLGGTSQALGLPAEIGLPQLAPGIAGLLMLLIFRKDGLRISFAKHGIPATRYLAAFGIPMVVGGLIFGFSLALFDSFTFGSISAGITAPILIWMPIGAFGEEVGWRGYLDKRLSLGTSGLLAAVITGLLWCLIHVHFYANGALFMVFAFLMFSASSVVIHAVVSKYDFNVMLAFLFHLGINISLLLSFSVINEPGFMAGYALLWTVAAVIAVMLRRELFFPRPSSFPPV